MAEPLPPVDEGGTHRDPAKVFRRLPRRPDPMAATLVDEPAPPPAPPPGPRRFSRRKAAFLSALLLAVGIGGWFAWRAYRAETAEGQAEQLEALVQERKVDKAEAFIASLRATRASLTRVPALAQEIRTAADAIKAERERIVSIEQNLFLFSATSDQRFGEQEAEAVQEQLENTRREIAATPPQFRPALEGKLALFEQRWRAFLATRSNARNEEFATLLVDVERWAGLDLDPLQSVDRHRVRMQNVLEREQKLRAYAESPLAELKIRPELKARLEPLTKRIEELNAPLRKYDEAMAALTTSPEAEGYLQAVAALASSPFVTAPEVHAAKGIVELPLADLISPGVILFPDHPQAWSLLREHPDPPLTPTSAITAEERKFAATTFRDDPNLAEVFLYVLTNSQLRQTLIVRGPLSTEPGWGKFAEMYLPASVLDQAFFSRMEYGVFNGQLKLTAAGEPFTIESSQSAPEFASAKRIGLGEVLPATGDHWTQPLLPLLDLLNTESSANPLFRAYFVLRLHELAARRPDGWGFFLAPNVARDRDRLVAARADGIKSGDWWAPVRVEALTDSLTQCFTRAAKLSYVAQAAAVRAIAQRVMAGGIVRAGYASPQGDAILVSSPSPEQQQRWLELWGLDEEGKMARLFARNAGTDPWRALTPAKPLTFLLAYNGDREALLREVYEAQKLPLEARGVEEDWTEFYRLHEAPKAVPVLPTPAEPPAAPIDPPSTPPPPREPAATPSPAARASSSAPEPPTRP